MVDQLNETIKQIKERDFSQASERAIEQSIILKVLSNLGWDTFNDQEVFPQYMIDNKKVDYSLRINGQNKVFIEVKKTSEELERHQEQLLNYAFRSGIKIAILTNGIDWWFYLPLLEVHWKQRKFYSINLKSQKEDEIAYRFVDFLSKNNMLSDKAIEIANQYHSSNLKREIVMKSIPIAWNSIIGEHNEILVELLLEETEKISGFLPEKNDIDSFLNKVNSGSVSFDVSDEKDFSDVEEEYAKEENGLTNVQEKQQVHARPQRYVPKKSKRTILKVTLNNNKVIQEDKAIDTFIKVVQFFGISNVMQNVSINSVYPLIIDKEQLKEYDNRFYKKIADTFYIYSNTSTTIKKQYLENIAAQLNQQISIEIVDKYA
jgi:hypothetical protein